MKKVFLSAFLVVFGVLLMTGQRYIYEDFDSSVATDTLNDQDTLIFTLSKVLTDVYYMSWQVVADSISGATGATAQPQVSNDGTNWVDFGTAVTINGVSTNLFSEGDTILARKLRLWVTSPSSTQKTFVNPALVLKRVDHN